MSIRIIDKRAELTDLATEVGVTVRAVSYETESGGLARGIVAGSLASSLGRHDGWAGAG